MIARWLALASLLACPRARAADSRPSVAWLDCEGAVTLDSSAVVFPNAFAQAPGSWARRASIAASRYPESLGALAGDATLSSGTVVLEAVLKGRGYATEGFAHATAAAVWLSRQGGPAHAFVTESGGCDAAIRVLRGGAGARPLVLAVTVSPPERGAALSDKSLRSTILLWAPGLRARALTGVVQLIDVAPTLLELAGVAVPAAFEGRSLFSPASRPAFSAAARGARGPDLFSMRTQRWRLTYDKTAGGAQLFDLADDPLGERDVLAAHPAEAVKLIQELLAHVSRAGVSAQLGGRPSQELLDELIERGYW